MAITCWGEPIWSWKPRSGCRGPRPWPPSAVFPDYKPRAASEFEKLEHELVPIWDAGACRQRISLLWHCTDLHFFPLSLPSPNSLPPFLSFSPAPSLFPFILAPTCKGEHMILFFVCLAHFTLHFQPTCCKWQNFTLLIA